MTDPDPLQRLIEWERKHILAGLDLAEGSRELTSKAYYQGQLDLINRLERWHRSATSA